MMQIQNKTHSFSFFPQKLIRERERQSERRGGKALNHTSSVDQFERLSSKMSATSTRRGQQKHYFAAPNTSASAVRARSKKISSGSVASGAPGNIFFIHLAKSSKHISHRGVGVNIFPIEELFLFLKMQSGSKRELLYRGKRKRSSLKKYKGREGKLSLNITII